VHVKSLYSMKKIYVSILFVCLAMLSFGQSRYLDRIFADVSVQSDINYATNISFLLSDFSDQVQLGIDIATLKGAVATNQPIPAHFYNPADATSKVKVRALNMDIYEPVGDTVSKRPVVIYLHTGNFLPPPINGSPTGLKTDSSAINMCRNLAARGFVAISVEYRLGWNPLATTVQERRGQLLNAVYRAIHDTKQAVRYVRDSASSLRIDPDKICLFGEGTGGYVALAYATLDDPLEMELPKFLNPLTNKSYIDTLQVGSIDGSGGLLNLYGSSSTSTEVQAVVNTGGALADTSWLSAGDAAMISFHCVRDPFAPFSEGTVIVPTTNEDVVDVQGANLFIQKANQLGNNDAFKDLPDGNPYTDVARARYGQTYSYIYPAPLDQITVNTDVEGLFPVIRPQGASLFQNEAGPWQWWDPTSANATAEVQPGVTAHMASLQSNPNMSPAQGRAYQDTIMGYACIRIALAMGIDGVSASAREYQPVNGKLYPNPANNIAHLSFGDNVRVSAVNVYDVTGRKVLTENTIKTSQIQLNLNNLESGSYFVVAETDKGVWSGKLLKN
jgi:poly(3-hydroxybutyrate) depolymerase